LYHLASPAAAESLQAQRLALVRLCKTGHGSGFLDGYFEFQPQAYRIIVAIYVISIT
jgi:hypothetical protein